jgi:hypothetical protein
MDATLTVPAGFVPYLRSGLFGEFGATAEKLSSLALQFGSAAPDGVYMPQLQNFFTLCMLLGEVGWKDLPTEPDVVINLGVSGPQIVKGLKEEHQTLQQQLDEMPASTTKGIRDAAAARVAEFGSSSYPWKRRQLAHVAAGSNRTQSGRPLESYPPAHRARGERSTRHSPEGTGARRRMEQMEATVLDRPGETVKAALRSGVVVIVALRLGAAQWEPLYAMCGCRRVALSWSFCFSLEAIAALEAATFMQ